VDKVSCGHVVLEVGIWYYTCSTRELCCSGARRDLVQWVIGLGDSNTLGSGGVTSSCGVSLGTLGEAMSSKTSLVSVACWKGVTRAYCASVRGRSSNAGKGGGNHVVEPGVSLLLSFFPGHEKGCC
jgi:hypothetical protein